MTAKEAQRRVANRVGGFFSEFWAFAARGNAAQLAVAVVVGGAFSAVVNSIVNDIITPFISLGTNNVDFSHWGYTIRPEQTLNGSSTPALVVGYGHLIQVTINFLIVALSIFLMYKLFAGAFKRMMSEQEEEEKAAPPEPISTQEKLLSEIRDLLKEQVEGKKGSITQ
ncbi:MAG: large conductance mechanosensitive channel protein MscL [Candidatus Pacebacteria bacterium]|nr:large conductance mechanosensitive channel protein MscL [Candidatus Paceibacterota bacterium]